MSEFDCMLRVGVVGISHKTASLQVREDLARKASQIERLGSSVEEGWRLFSYPLVVVSTCNRTEIYFSAQNLQAAYLDLLSFFHRKPQLTDQRGDMAAGVVYRYFGFDCFLHLCRVIAGLDSAILGETEIQRQVKVAYGRAALGAFLPGCLHYVFQKGLRVGKLVRNSMVLEQGAASLYGAIQTIAEQHLGKLVEKSLLLVGYSGLGREILSYFRKRGIEKITLSTRGADGCRVSGVEVRGRDVLQQWQKFDWIICASQSEEYLISGKGDRNHLIFDLGVPRNVDPSIEGACLFNIEQVHQMMEKDRLDRACEARFSEEAVRFQVRRFAQLYQKRSKIGMSGESRKRDRIADVLHASCK